jgi:hypothetical protein
MRYPDWYKCFAYVVGFSQFLFIVAKQVTVCHAFPLSVTQDRSPLNAKGQGQNEVNFELPVVLSPLIAEDTNPQAEHQQSCLTELNPFPPHSHYFTDHAHLTVVT